MLTTNEMIFRFFRFFIVFPLSSSVATISDRHSDIFTNSKVYCAGHEKYKLQFNWKLFANENKFIFARRHGPKTVKKERKIKQCRRLCRLFFALLGNRLMHVRFMFRCLHKTCFQRLGIARTSFAAHAHTIIMEKYKLITVTAKRSAKSFFFFRLAATEKVQSFLGKVRSFSVSNWWPHHRMLGFFVLFFVVPSRSSFVAHKSHTKIHRKRKTVDRWLETVWHQIRVMKGRAKNARHHHNVANFVVARPKDNSNGENDVVIHFRWRWLCNQLCQAKRRTEYNWNWKRRRVF